MAIKFVDEKPEDGKPKKAPMSKAERLAEDVQATPEGGQADGQLPFAKPPPKKGKRR